MNCEFLPASREGCMDTNVPSSAIPSAWESQQNRLRSPRALPKDRNTNSQGMEGTQGQWDLTSVQAMLPCSSGLQEGLVKVTFLQCPKRSGFLPQHPGGSQSCLGAPCFAPGLFAEPWQGISAHTQPTEYFLDEHKPYFNCCTIILFF